MNILNFIYKLHSEGFILWSENGSLKYRQYKECANFDDTITQIKKYKPEIIELLEINCINKMLDPDKEFILKTSGNIAELSYAQERMHFIEKYNNGSRAYNIPTLTYELEIKETWQEEALKDSVLQIVSRHEILRTLIKENENGQSYQEVQSLSFKEFKIPTKQLTTTEELRKQLTIDAYHIYKLDKEYPIKATIYNVKEQKYLSIVVHHIAFDGWSIGIFLQELKQYYKYYARKALGRQNIEIPQELKIQYKDFALWQKHKMQGSFLQNELNYWRKKLHGYESLNLGFDKPRPKTIDYQGGKEFFEIEIFISDALRHLAMRIDVSLYSLLLAAYCIALRAHTCQEDIIIGTPAANRHYESTQNLIGLFVNTLVLRVNTSGAMPILHYIQGVGKCVLEAQLHQNLPFEKLVEELVQEKDISRNPIFQVVFALENFASGVIPNTVLKADIDQENLESIIRGYYPEDVYNISKFDLSMFIDDSGNILKGNVEYATSLFKQTTIKRFIITYTHILRQLASYSQEQLQYIKVRDIEYLPDKHNILYGWDNTSQDYSKNKSVRQLIESHAEQQGDAIALVCQNKHLTYSELNNKANQLAHYLQSQNIKAGSTIVILTEKSIETVIAIAAVLKTESAYVPIEPTYPKDRILYILNDSNAKAILTQQTLQDLYQGFNGDVVCLDDFPYTKYSDKNLNFDISIQSLAYIIYTSGSTGKPKGVLINHMGLFNTLISVNKKFNVTSNDTLLVLSSLTFDLSIYDILGLLIAGGKVIIPMDSKDAAYWSKLVKEQQVTIWNTVPQLAKLWSYHEDIFPTKRNLNKIRLFLLSGDSIPSDLPDHLKQIADSQIVCLGGATEASIWSIWHEPKERARVLYGRPMPNQQMYILDSNLKPVPPGVRGDIYIGGLGLAIGYLGKPELTAEKFMASPFAKGRIYCTGDTGKFTSDGDIVFLGRNDFQVKIRGYRIELGEIEAVLNSVDSVKQSIVLARDGQMLLAYVTLNKLDDQLKIKALLQKKCQDILPDYMRPHDIIIIDVLPVTSNGKIDRNKLIKEYKSIIKLDLAAPKEGIEQILANIWCELLQVEKVYRHDNFFKLGGDSIMSIQMVSRAKKEGILIDVKQIFETPTIFELAKHTESLINNNFEPEEGEFELLPIQQWFFDHHNDINHFNQAVWFITNQDLDFAKLEKSINQVRANHGAFRLRFKKHDSKWNQYYQTELLELNLRIENTKLSNQELIETINKIHQSIDITNGPIDHIVWFNGYGLLWITHHLIIDGVSWKILLDDLDAAYLNKPLIPKSNSYKDWSIYIQNYQNLDKVCAFYSKNDIQLLCNHTQTNSCMKGIFIEFPNDITEKFLKEANKCYDTSAKDLLITALKLAIGDVTNEYGISIDLEGHGREKLESNIDLSATVGWFTAIYPVTLQITKPNNLSDAIKTIKQYLRKIPHNGLSYQIAIRKGKLKDQNSSIIFNYLGQLDNAGEVFKFGNYPIGHGFSNDNPSRYTIEINGAVKNGILSFVWQYSDAIAEEQVIQMLSRFKIRFTEIVLYCTDPKNYATGFDVNLDEDELLYIKELFS